MVGNAEAVFVEDAERVGLGVEVREVEGQVVALEQAEMLALAVGALEREEEAEALGEEEVEAEGEAEEDASALWEIVAVEEAEGEYEMVGVLVAVEEEQDVEEAVGVPPAGGPAVLRGAPQPLLGDTVRLCEAEGLAEEEGEPVPPPPSPSPMGPPPDTLGEEVTVRDRRELGLRVPLCRRAAVTVGCMGVRERVGGLEREGVAKGQGDGVVERQGEAEGELEPPGAAAALAEGVRDWLAGTSSPSPAAAAPGLPPTPAPATKTPSVRGP